MVGRAEGHEGTLDVLQGEIVLDLGVARVDAGVERCDRVELHGSFAHLGHLGHLFHGDILDFTGQFDVAQLVMGVWHRVSTRRIAVA